MDSTFWVADWRDGELFKLGGGIFIRVSLFEWFGDSVDDDDDFDDDDFEVGVDLFVVSDGGCSNVVVAVGGSVVGDGGESA